MTDVLTVSVVIPTYGRAARLPEALLPLMADPSAHEILVVVDGSDDGSLEIARRLAERDGRIRPRYIENVGLSRARRAGAEAATGDVVLFLDDDVIAAHGLPGGHARRHAEGPRRVVVGYMPVLLPARRRPGMSGTYLYAGEYERRVGEWERDAGAILEGFWAGNHSLRRVDYLAVAATPQAAARYHEDLEFGLRCQDAGLRGVFDRSLMARHEHQRSTEAALRDARASGHGLAAIARDRGRTTESLLAELEGAAPGPVRAAIRAARDDRAHAAARRALRLALRAAGRLHAFRGEELLLELLRRVEQQRAVLEAARDGRA